MNKKQDIISQEDVVIMVNSFYDRVNADELLSPVFNDFAKVDWPEHLFHMYRFWDAHILGIAGYKGFPLPGQLKLPVSQPHFNRWLELFNLSIDEHFAGHNVDSAKRKAERIAVTFQYKIALFK